MTKKTLAKAFELVALCASSKPQDAKKEFDFNKPYRDEVEEEYVTRIMKEIYKNERYKK